MHGELIPETSSTRFKTYKLKKIGKLSEVETSKLLDEIFKIGKDDLTKEINERLERDRINNLPWNNNFYN